MSRARAGRLTVGNQILGAIDQAETGFNQIDDARKRYEAGKARRQAMRINDSREGRDVETHGQTMRRGDQDFKKGELDYDHAITGEARAEGRYGSDMETAGLTRDGMRQDQRHAATAEAQRERLRPIQVDQAGATLDSTRQGTSNAYDSNARAEGLHPAAVTQGELNLDTTRLANANQKTANYIQQLLKEKEDRDAAIQRHNWPSEMEKERAQAEADRLTAEANQYIEERGLARQEIVQRGKDYTAIAERDVEYFKQQLVELDNAKTVTEKETKFAEVTQEASDTMYEIGMNSGNPADLQKFMEGVPFFAVEETDTVEFNKETNKITVRNQDGKVERVHDMNDERDRYNRRIETEKRKAKYGEKGDKDDDGPSRSDMRLGRAATIEDAQTAIRNITGGEIAGELGATREREVLVAIEARGDEDLYGLNGNTVASEEMAFLDWKKGDFLKPDEPTGQQMAEQYLSDLDVPSQTMDRLRRSPTFSDMEAVGYALSKRSVKDGIPVQDLFKTAVTNWIRRNSPGGQ